MTKICFVCLGNICRSTMAEAVMQDLAGAGDLEIESRGTSGWEHGNPIHPGTQKILTANAIPFRKDKGSQRISAEDFAYFDYLIGMDEQNVRDMKAVVPEGLAHKIYQFEEESVPDPYYTGDFEDTYQRVSRGCRTWLARLKKSE